MRRLLILSAAAFVLIAASVSFAWPRAAAERHFLYVAEPGIRNYVEYGGVGVLVFDMDKGYTFVRRIPSQDVPAGKEPENVKGIAANARTGRLYVSTFRRVIAYDLTTDRRLWIKEFDGGCDRLALSPDGKLLYVPSFDGHHHREDRAELRRTQHDLWSRWEARLPRRSEVTDSVDRRPVDAQGDRWRRAVLEHDPAVHDQRRPDALLRQRQRSPGVRSRRHHDRQDAPPGGSGRLREGPGEAPRMSEPRHRSDAGRTRALARRRRERRRAHLRRAHNAAEADRHHQASGSTGLDHVQSRWPAGVPVDWRRGRHGNPQDRRDAPPRITYRAHRSRTKPVGPCRARKSWKSCSRTGGW